MNTKERRRPAGTHTRKADDVVYTQPGPFRKERFFLQLLTVVAVVLALVFGLSIFFKVDKEQVLVSFQVAVDGEHKYSERDVVEASGIKDGEGLLSIRESEISGRILEKLPYITQVRVRIKLPDTVKIEVVETDVVYSAEAADGTWWMIRADGKVLQKSNAADADQKTKIIGVKLDAPVVGAQAIAYQPQAQQTEEEAEVAVPAVLAADQLSAVLQILTCLEANGIIGDAVSVDVTNLNGIELWYEDRYQVNLGDQINLNYKISAMKAAIDEMKSYQRGMLDVSFTVIEDQVVYTPFE